MPVTMRSLPGSALSVSASALLLVGAACLAQENAKSHGSKYPRPNLASEGQAIVRPNGLTVKFFESVSDDEGSRQYILYEPPIFLVTRPDDAGEQAIHAMVSPDAVVTLHFHWDTDPKLTQDAIRAHLDATPGYGDSFQNAIIKPLFVTDGWFESALDPTVRSTEFPPNSFETFGEILTYFKFGALEQAQNFVDSLDGTSEIMAPTQLNFRYSFSGDARDTCTAEVTSAQVAQTDRFKSLKGGGGSRQVARHQLLDIAQDMVKSVAVRTTCRDLGAADRLVRQALDQLGAPERLGTWAQLGEFSGLSPSDFAADVSRHLDEKEGSVHRDQIRSALTQAESLQKQGKIAVGWGPFMAAVSAGFSEASQEARSEFEDHLDKRSLASSWDGERYVPKSLDVHSTESIVNSWRGGVRVAYTKLSDESQLHAITLTHHNRLATVTVTPEEGLDLRRAQDRLSLEIDSVRRDLSIESARLSTRLDYKLSSLSTNHRRTQSQLDSRIRHLSRDLSRLTGAMMVRTYAFRLDGGDKVYQRSDFETGVSANDYPLALVNNWSVDPRCSTVLGPNNPALFVNVNSTTPPKEWLVAARDGDLTNCSWFNVVVTFIKGPIIGKSKWFQRRGRTNGGVLSLR